MNRHTQLSIGASEDTDLAQLLLKLWSHRYLLVCLPVIVVLGAAVYLRFAVPQYTSEMRIAPVSAQQGLSGGALAGLGNLSSLAGISIGKSSSAEPFELYIEAMTSRGVAERLAVDPVVLRSVFEKEWDAERGAWRRPPEPSGIKAALRGLIGLRTYPWRAPDAVRLNEYLKEAVEVTREPKSPIVTASIDHPDPAFGALLLRKIDYAADRMVRERALRQAASYAAYLSRKLQTVQLAEHRQALAEAMSEQERSIMLAGSGVPYAANIIDGPVTSRFPTYPRPSLVLVGAAVVGLVLGMLLALIDVRSIFAQMSSARSARR
jgi:uncharacterized protein involved in exopolysaccharide biosynthesis